MPRLPPKLNERQLEILHEVCSLYPVTALELSTSLGMTLGATRAALKRLERRGLVQFSSYRNRPYRWSPTDLGEEVGELVPTLAQHDEEAST